MLRLPLLLSILLLLSSVADAVPKPQQLTSLDQVPERVAKSDWQSIRAAYEAGRHALQPVEGGWQAGNPGQQWSTKFDRRGFIASPTDGGWTWRLELQSYGFDQNQTAVSGTTVLNYTALKVWDADGKVLTSRFEAARASSVRLLVDEADARFPITIDPVAQQAYLNGSNAMVGDQFGYSEVVSSDTAAIRNGTDQPQVWLVA